MELFPCLTVTQVQRRAFCLIFLWNSVQQDLFKLTAHFFGQILKLSNVHYMLFKIDLVGHIMWQPSIPAGCPVFDGFIVTNAEWKWQKYVADRWCTCKETKWQYKKPVLNQDCKDIFQKYYTQGSFPFLLYKKSWECLLPLQCILVEQGPLRWGVTASFSLISLFLDFTFWVKG